MSGFIIQNKILQMNCQCCPESEQIWEKNFQNFHKSLSFKDLDKNESDKWIHFNKINEPKISLKRKHHKCQNINVVHTQTINKQPQPLAKISKPLIVHKRIDNLPIVPQHHVVSQHPITLKIVQFQSPRAISYTPKASHNIQASKLLHNSFTNTHKKTKIIQFPSQKNLPKFHSTAVKFTYQPLVTNNEGKLSKQIDHMQKIQEIKVQLPSSQKIIYMTPKQQNQQSQSDKSNLQKDNNQQTKFQKGVSLSMNQLSPSAKEQLEVPFNYLSLKKINSLKSPNSPDQKNHLFNSKLVKSLRNFEQIKCKDTQSIANGSRSSDRLSQIIYSSKDFPQMRKAQMTSSQTNFNQKYEKKIIETPKRSIIWQGSRKQSVNQL